MKAAYLDNAQYAKWLLRLGLAAVFLYAAISSIMHPAFWTGYLPAFLGKITPLETLVKIFAVYELLLAAWLLSGKFKKTASLVCALTFAGIILFNPHQLIITFRDIGLLFMALALLYLPQK